MKTARSHCQQRTVFVQLAVVGGIHSPPPVLPLSHRVIVPGCLDGPPETGHVDRVAGPPYDQIVGMSNSVCHGSFETQPAPAPPDHAGHSGF